MEKQERRMTTTTNSCAVPPIAAGGLWPFFDLDFVCNLGGEEEQEEDEEEKSRLALLQARLQQFYDGVFGTSDTKEVGETRKKLEAKVG